MRLELIMKYLRYYISTLTLCVGLYLCLAVQHGPTILFLGFSLLIILGELIIKEEDSRFSYSFPFLLNLPMYINLPLLILFLLVTTGLLSQSALIQEFVLNYIDVNLISVRESLNIIDKVSINNN